MKPANFLFVLSDQHSRDALGCYGHPVVQTPNLDRLAQRGTRFDSASTNCPICVPARASLATGRYVHQIRYWDNAFPYDGRVPSWHHRLREQGFRVDSIGKLHFSGSGNDHGFAQEIEPLHVVEGVGDILGCIRDDPPIRKKRSGITDSGCGDSSYLQYDRRNADNACQWLESHQGDDRPWALFLSFVCPHPPYISPPEYYDRYTATDLPCPPQWRQADWPRHPAIDYFRTFFDFDPQFSEDEIRNMTAAYLGACTFLDAQIGRVLGQLDALGLTDTTRVIYTSDHGECRGARGIYGKFTMYEESAGIPFIAAGPGVPAGNVVRTPVSLVDIFPTAVEAVGAALAAADADLPGASVWPMATGPDRNRTVFGEYHAVGSRHGIYMLRDLRYKYVGYVGEPSQLFDLEEDPNELRDRPDGGAELTRDYEARLRRLLDPDEVDALAKRDQAAVIESFGGREAVLQRGSFDNSPVPGESPAFKQH